MEGSLNLSLHMPDENLSLTVFMVSGCYKYHIQTPALDRIIDTLSLSLASSLGSVLHFTITLLYLTMLCSMCYRSRMISM